MDETRTNDALRAADIRDTVALRDRIPIPPGVEARNEADLIDGIRADAAQRDPAEEAAVLDAGIRTGILTEAAIAAFLRERGYSVYGPAPSYSSNGSPANGSASVPVLCDPIAMGG